MEYMADEMLEKLPEYLNGGGIVCRTVFEWIDGSKQKKRKIQDWEIRKFLASRKARGEDITLITNDEDSCKQVRADGLPVMYVPEVIREQILRSRG